MKAKYDFRVMPNLQGKEEELGLYPQLVTSGTITMKDLMERASRHSGFNPAEVLGIVTFLEDAMVEYLSQGYHVKLGDIGTFSAGLTSRKVMSKEEIRANSVHFDNVHFKADKKFRKKIGMEMKLERVEPYRAFQTSSDEYTPEERFQLLMAHLDANGFITCKKYSEITGLLKNKASAELRKWAEEGRISREGRVPHVMYLKKGIS
ncbi:MAG: HU family DNA-binding protein [Bacteroidaceae bacterium]|nr:HU family DNA-binding protein [Bacteroidaceae bacterium]